MAYPASIAICPTRPPVISDGDWAEMLVHIGAHVSHRIPERAWEALHDFALEHAPASEAEALEGLREALALLNRASSAPDLAVHGGREPEPIYTEYTYVDGVRICHHRYALALKGGDRWGVVYEERGQTYGAWLDVVFSWESRWDA